MRDPLGICARLFITNKKNMAYYVLCGGSVYTHASWQHTICIVQRDNRQLNGYALLI